MFLKSKTSSLFPLFKNSQYSSTIFCFQPCRSFISIENKNFFDLFGLEKKFSVDIGELDTKYKKLQQRFHPDRFSCRPEEEKNRAEAISSYINQAYDTLKVPKKRASYMLELVGESVNTLPISDISEDFLKDMLQLMELLNSGENFAEHDLQSLYEELKRDMGKLEEKLSQYFEQNEYEEAKKVLAKYNYFVRALQMIYEKLDVRSHSQDLNPKAEHQKL